MPWVSVPFDNAHVKRALIISYSVFKRLITTLKKANKDLDLQESKQTNKTNKIKLFSPPAVFYLPMYLLSTKISETDD